MAIGYGEHLRAELEDVPEVAVYSSPMGRARQTAALIADGVANTAGSLGPHAVLISLLLLSSALSQGLDGAPTVVLLAPVVFLSAEQLGISPRPLMMGVGLAASAAFLTPFRPPK